MPLAHSVTLASASGAAPPRFYYLRNFCLMLDSLERRDRDLLADDERQFMADFSALPLPSQALLVRLIMRKGRIFRSFRLNYQEIADLAAAAQGLTALGWLEDAPPLSLAELFDLFTKAELARYLPVTAPAGESKAALRARLGHLESTAQPLAAWWLTDEVVYRVLIGATCDRLRLMFFGNFRQELSEFVLADLGVFNYETYETTTDSRPFATRRHVEDFHELYTCRDLLRGGTEPAAVSARLPPRIEDCEWLEERRQKLCFQIGRGFEAAGDIENAAVHYDSCSYPEAAVRAQRLARRAAGRRATWRRAVPAVPSFDLPVAPAEDSVETLVARQLQATHTASCVRYVENALVNSLFGLLCWPAVFAPVPGAFFHPFHYGPADLGTPGFVDRRRQAFDACLAELDAGSYRATIVQRFRDKYGKISPFVTWAALDESLLHLALECIPPRHLLLSFEWMLRDLRVNRAGFPDLVQFWPQTHTYQLIEVKAPGDRLQDTQCRYLEFALTAGLPVSVCRVSWLASP